MNEIQEIDPDIIFVSIEWGIYLLLNYIVSFIFYDNYIRKKIKIYYLFFNILKTIISDII